MTTIRLGGLTLIGEPIGNGEIRTDVLVKDGASTLFLTADEWHSLVRAAAVVTAARRVCNRRMEHRAQNRDTFLVNDVEILGVLAAAIDSLDAGGDK